MRFTFLILFLAGSAFGATHPVNFSLVPDVAVFKKTERIEGFTLSIWGENEQMSFALGVVNGCRGNSGGFSLGALLNYSDDYTGVQVAPVNWSKKSHTGVQVGIFNFAQGVVKGIQFGLANYAEAGSNLIQLGFVNLLMQNKVWFNRFPKELAPFMIVANWRFD
jgi:hypothetical protein